MTEGDAGWRRSFALPAQGLLELTHFAPTGELNHINAEFAALIDDTLRPTLTVIAGPDCEIVEGRRLIDDADRRPLKIDMPDGALELTGENEMLNPPLPDRSLPDTPSRWSGETVTVAVVGSEGGLDLGREPYYPAVLPLGNMIVITSANGAGKPAPGATGERVRFISWCRAKTSR